MTCAKVSVNGTGEGTGCDSSNMLVQLHVTSPFGAILPFGCVLQIHAWPGAEIALFAVRPQVASVYTHMANGAFYVLYHSRTL
jgi:hypothetical protein